MHIQTNQEIPLPDSPEALLTEAGGQFLEALKREDYWSKIPLLNYTPLHQLKDISVVRFRGMVQDMQDPEIYLERYEVKCADGQGTHLQEGKYRDCLVLKTGEEIDYESSKSVHGERRTLFVVSLPGINTWTQEFEEQCNQRNLSKTTKSHNSDNTNTKKRSAPSEAMDTDEIPIQENNTKHESSKRQCTEHTASTSTTATSSLLAAEYLLNSPIPERPSKACMIKLYENFDKITLNTIIDVVGFLSVNPALDASTMDMDECGNFGNANELQAQNPPPSLIPRLHAIAVHQLPHTNPLLDARLSTQAKIELNMPAVYKELRTLLSLCLFNDELAAEYLLSHLMSTVYSRTEMQSVGKFALNMCNLPNELLQGYTKKLYEILELLLPVSHYLPMTLDNMNTVAFVPKKDYETNKLVSGLLQLAPHTHLVLDETHMEQGKLEANGVLGIQNLAHLINQQQIKCNFQFYEIDYNADIPVLVLSEGRSLLPHDFTLPLQTDSESVQLIEESLKAAHHYLQQSSRLDQFRRFLTKAKTCVFTLQPEHSEMIQSDFVEMRKANLLQNVDELHALLVLSRLLAIARGKEALDTEAWQLAKDMEAKRKQRVSELPKSSKNVSNNNCNTNNLASRLNCGM